jgi:hypothetical protein
VRLDLVRPDHAYFFGFVLGDGTLSRAPGQKGALTVELSATDAEHLRALAALLEVPSSIYARVRDTNFKQQHASAVLSVRDLGLRQELLRHGFIEGRKSDTCTPPVGRYSEPDFWRGVIDADGSIGFAASGLPFISLCVSSPPLAAAYAEFLECLLGYRKHVRPNRRDGAHNLMVWREQAQILARALYDGDGLALPRKAAKAREVCAWTRPAGLLRKPHRRWHTDEDAVALRYDTAEAAARLGRSVESVRQRQRVLRRRSA